jgi:hypothetical protein
VNRVGAVRALLGPPCHARPDATLMNDTTPLYLAARAGHHEVGWRRGYDWLGSG